MEFKDYYKTLGVAREASADDIKTAYRKLARKFHPDVSKEKNAEARFKEIGEANEVLKDPEKRAAYDADVGQWERQQDAGGAQRGGGPQDFQPAAGLGQPDSNSAARDAGGNNDPFDGSDRSDFFEALFGRARRRTARRCRRSVARR